MIEKNILQSLHDKFNAAIKSNEDSIASGTCNYNSHLAIRKKHEEVGLHSNFLYSLINPRGDHFKGSEFLYSFLKAINAIEESEENMESLASARVTREQYKIDLLIETPDHWYIIENKIYAGDQQSQIARYIEKIKSIDLERVKNNKRYENYNAKKISVIYLTLSGAKPSDKSLAQSKGVAGMKISHEKNIVSYRLILATYKQIQNWCSQCLMQDYVTNSPAIFYSIASYKNVLDILFGNSANSISTLSSPSSSVITNEDFFLSLTYPEMEAFINAVKQSSFDMSSYSFFNRNLIKNNKIKDPTHLLQSIFNGIIHRFRDVIYSEAAINGLDIASAKNGIQTTDIKIFEQTINWYTEKEKRTGKHRFMAFKPRNSKDDFWYVIYFAKHAFYQGFVEIDNNTKKVKILDNAPNGFEKHVHAPYKDKIFSSPLGIIHYDNKDFNINTINQLREPKDFFYNVMEKSIKEFWNEESFSPNESGIEYYLTY